LAALRTFEEEGLAHQRRIGPSSLWSLETGSYLAKTLAPLAKLDEGAQRRLAATMTKALRGSGALEARLFGSVAAGKEQAQSDIDLFVVFPDRRRLERWRPKLERARDQVQEDFGSFLSPTLFVKADLRRATPRRLLGEARRSGIALEVGP
jgi:predicted nucleotidyltransferase